MLAPERQQQILALLEERGSVRTIDLAEEFQVTDETIRRDFQALSVENRLRRIHGGATSLNGRPKLQSFTERRFLMVEQKRAIARAALHIIEADRTYAFDSSTTGFELVSSMPDIPCRVITNAYSVMDQAVRFEAVELISLGGRYQPKTQTFIGHDGFAAVRRHNINTAFVSCIGLDLNQGASEGFEEQAGFKETLVHYAEAVILLVDSSKFNQRSEYFFARLEDFSQIITDHEAEPHFVDALRDRGCRVIIAD